MSITIALAQFILSTPMEPPEPYVERFPDQLVEFKMIPIPGGVIEIRGEKHVVEPYFIAETEITWDVYDIYYLRLDQTPEEAANSVDAESRPSRPYGAVDRGFGHQGYPAIGVASHASKAFCAWLNEKTGKNYRIPTEAEWEYAARANAPLPDKWDDYATWWDNSDDKTKPVKKKEPNAWGLYDMIGNASEWVIGPEGVMTTAGGHFNYEGDALGPSLREPYDIKWQERDPQNPKSRWWLSDGPQVGFRIVISLKDLEDE